MRALVTRKLWFVMFLWIVLSTGAFAQSLAISGISPTSGPVGLPVTITGTGFGATQLTSTVALNGTTASVMSWSDTAILAVVPAGATSGTFTVTVGGTPASSTSFTVTPLPAGWSDGDVGTVGVAGTSSYASGVFTLTGAGYGNSGSSDSYHYVYQALSGDGSITARVVSATGYGQIGVSLRETVSDGAAQAGPAYQSSYTYFYDRPSTGSSLGSTGGSYHALPYWMRVTRSGSSFSGYTSTDGINWLPVGSSQTITMATSVYVGLMVSSGTTSSTASANFDNVSVTSTPAPAPAITSLSATTGAAGAPFTIQGTGFGSSEGSSVVTLNGALVVITSWSATSISCAVPAGATSGPVVVSVGPSMNDSNPVVFEITSQPLPSPWLNQDVGQVGIGGSATYSNGVFSLTGAGSGASGMNDSFHYTYQTLSGDGSISARIVSSTGYGQIGVMIRETLTDSASEAATLYQSNYTYFYDRSSTGASTAQTGGAYHAVPYWVEVVRSGDTFTSYSSPDGLSWTQVGSSQTIPMATNVLVGLVASSGTNSSTGTVNFDNVSVSSTASPAPNITGVSPEAAVLGGSITVTGTGFGSAQNLSVVSLNGLSLPVSSWSDTSIVATIPTGAVSGPLTVTVSPTMNVSNGFGFLIGNQPLSSWMDVDLGSVGSAGSASYSNGTITISGAGQISGSLDAMNFVSQPLSGDGTIIARVVSASGSGVQAGLMIRETLNPSANNFFAFYSSYIYVDYRSTTGSNEATAGNSGYINLPYWIKVVRSGNVFTAYNAPDGENWTQIATSETISMATNVYVGLAVESASNPSAATATFDSVSITSAGTTSPVITNISATTGAIGSQVAIGGTGFGVLQPGSAVLLNGVPVTVDSWQDSAISITIPTGATSGPLVVEAAPGMNASNYVMFTVTSNALPIPWLDQDIGVTGVVGSSGFANGVFTMNGGGYGTGSTSDSLHFVYQPLSGDGTIVARILSVENSSTNAGVMIRETLSPTSTQAYAFYANQMNFYYRTTTGANSASNGNFPITGLSYWVKLVRSGNTFTPYTSPNGIYWTQLESSETITMATTVYVGLAVSSTSNTALGTATFDSVSINSAATVAPVISSLSATTGAVGSQFTISGTGFGAYQNGSQALLNNVPLTIEGWSDTAVTVQLATGATSGQVEISIAPSMNDSNPADFTVTSQALPLPWLDEDIGAVGTAGSASYSGGTFTVQSSGTGVSGSSDGIHFVYQPLSGDGTIIARVASLSGGYSPQAGVMIRETLDPSSTVAFAFSQNYLNFDYRTTTGGSLASNGTSTGPVPYWLKLVRTGSTFTAYMSPDGSTWTQLTTSATVSMASTVYVGLGVANAVNTSTATATFDNVSLTIGTTPFVTAVDPVLGGVGTSVTISGSNFGSAQGTSTVTFNGAAATYVSNWADSTIVATVPNSASSGTVNVTVNSIAGISSASFNVIRPVISSVSPPAAAVGGTITITGTGFGPYVGSGEVQFNGGVSTGYPWSDTSVTATVPTGATSGSISVIEDGVASNTLSFTVLEGISVTTIYPVSGAVGTSVQITGTGFGSAQNGSIVTFDGVQATATSWTDTQIVATVPPNAVTGPVTVEVAGNTGTGRSFEVSAVITLTDSLGHQSTYTSAIAGGKWYLANAQGSGCSTCTVRGSTQFTYDGAGNVTSVTDPLGHVTSYTYDANQNVLTQSVQADSGYATTTYTYNAFSEPLTVTDPLGNTTTNTYDARGNLLTTTTPSPDGHTPGSTTSYAYNSLGEMTQITDPLGHVTRFSYTSAGLIHTVTDAQNNVTTYGYDSHGNRTSVTDAVGHQTTFAYDAGNRLTTTTYPGGSTTVYGYDYRGRRTSVTDQNGKLTTYAYDDADRLTSVTDAADDATIYSYDSESEITSIEDANSHATSFTYDAYGRVTETTFPSMYYEQYGYDAANNLIGRTDRKGQTINYVYNDLNQLTEKTYPDSTTVAYVYDLVGNLGQVTDPSGTYGFTYDNMGRLASTTTQYAFLSSVEYTFSYTYDADSDRLSMTDPQGGVTSYTYDARNHLSSLTPPSSIAVGAFNFNYDGVGGRIELSRPNGVSSEYSYDNMNRLTIIADHLGSVAVDGSVYTVDPVGNYLTKVSQLSGQSYGYTYDSIYELTQVTRNSAVAESYSYDHVGNRLASIGAVSYSNDSSNELTATSNASYIHDRNGNTTSETDSSGTTTFGWDFENRLISEVMPGSSGSVAFKYDPFGRRVERIAPSESTVFVYDGASLFEVLTSTGGVKAEYVQDQNLDEPLAESRLGTTRYYERDAIDSITSLSDASGTVVQTYDYDAFGNQTASSGSLTNLLRYTARELEAENGLYYYRARYYDPKIGRFISEDPLGFFGAKNFYVYALNRPTKLTDPNGLSAQDVQRIRDACHLCVQNLVKQGERRPGSGSWSAFLNDQQSAYSAGGLLTGVHYLGCKDQAERCKGALDNLSPQRPFDANWNFDTALWWGGSHTIVQGKSSDPNDPIVYCDPWRDFTWTAPAKTPWFHYIQWPVGPTY